MAKVVFIQNGEEVAVEAAEDGSKSLLEVAQDNDIHMDQACGGNGVCTTCLCKIHDGAENLTELNDAEDMMGIDDGSGTMRLGCQARVTGDVKVEPAF